jgi:hypothetical protein
MAVRAFGYISATTSRPASHTRRQPRTKPRPVGQPAAYVNPLAGLSDFFYQQQQRVGAKLRRSVRRVQRAHQRSIEASGTDVQFVESRKG